jgi:hypothetical protein
MKNWPYRVHVSHKDIPDAIIMVVYSPRLLKDFDDIQDFLMLVESEANMEHLDDGFYVEAVEPIHPEYPA